MLGTVARPLYFQEEILLLALRDEKGTIEFGAGQYPYVLSGAILAELLLGNRISLDDSRKHLINVVDSAPFGDPILDGAIQQIQESKRRKSLQAWVSKIAGTRKLKERVAEELCYKGVLDKNEALILGLFKTKRYPERDPEPERLLRERLQSALFSDKTEIDARTTILISLTYRSQLLAIPFSGKDLRKNKKRIERIINGEMIGKITGDVIQTIQTAIAVAAIMPAITAGAATTHC